MQTTAYIHNTFQNSGHTKNAQTSQLVCASRYNIGLVHRFKAQHFLLVTTETGIPTPPFRCSHFAGSRSQLLCRSHPPCSARLLLRKTGQLVRSDFPESMLRFYSLASSLYRPAKFALCSGFPSICTDRADSHKLLLFRKASFVKGTGRKW